MIDKDLVLVVSATDILSIVHWHKAIGAVIAGRAEVLESNGRVIRSQSLELPWPDVIMMKNTYAPRLLKPPPQRRIILERDAYTCQYKGCPNPHPAEHLLQRDHVYPKSRGGETSFANLVTACHHCNSKKRNRTLAEAGMHLIREPQDVTPSTLAVALKRKQPRKIRATWQKYIDIYGGKK